MKSLPTRRRFLASDHNAAIGTLTIGLDSTDGLKVDGAVPGRGEQRFRDAGLRICEFTKLAMDRRARSPRLLASLFHVAYIYAHRVNAVDTSADRGEPAACSLLRDHAGLQGHCCGATQPSRQRTGGAALARPLPRARGRSDCSAASPKCAQLSVLRTRTSFPRRTRPASSGRLRRRTKTLPTCSRSAPRVLLTGAGASLH